VYKVVERMIISSMGSMLFNERFKCRQDHNRRHIGTGLEKHG